MPEKPENELNEQARQSIEELKTTIRQEVFSEQKRQRRNQLIYAGLGVIVGVAVTAALFQWWGTIAKIQPLLVGVLVVAILAVGGAAVAFIWFRDSIFGKFFKAGVASYEAGIENATQAFVPLLTKLLPKLDTAELQTGIDALKKSGLQIAAYFAYLRARRLVMGWLVALAAGLAAFLGTTLLVKQNELLREQTAYAKQQISLAQQQAHLTEAARRSSYVFLMDNILNQVNEELKSADTTPYHASRRLSTVTIGRIAALSQSLRPIRYLVEGDTLSGYLSPERGQLLLALVYARLDTVHTYPEIYAKSDFSYADLEGAKLDASFLQKVNLASANLSSAGLLKANLFGADLFRADFSYADLNEADLSEADFSYADLKGAGLFRADLRRAHLNRADLRRAHLHWADLREANLNGVDLRGANLNGAELSEADLSETYLNGADLREANLNGVDLREANLNGVDLSEAELDSTRANSPAFIDSLKFWQVENWEEIAKNYQVDTTAYKDWRGRYYYLILPKNK